MGHQTLQFQQVETALSSLRVPPDSHGGLGGRFVPSGPKVGQLPDCTLLQCAKIGGRSSIWHPNGARWNL